MTTSQRRNQRASVEDLWRKRDGSPSKLDGQGKRWRARYVDHDGKEVARRFTRKTDAQTWLNNITSSLVTGSYIAPGAGKATIRQLHEQWVTTQAGVKATTKATRETTWRTHVEPYWADTAVGDIEKSAVGTWISQMSDANTSAATIENAVSVLRLICAMAVDEKRIVRNPCADLKLPAREHSNRAYLTHQQVNDLAAEIGDRYRPLVLFLAYTGLRFGEAVGLQAGDIDIDRRRVHVKRSITEVSGKLVTSTTKTRKTRTVPYPDFLDADLRNAITGKAAHEPVFTSPAGGVLRIASFRTRHFTPAVNRLRGIDDDGKPTTNYPKATMHDLRHSAVSLAISAGANVKAVQTMVGHASAAMTLDTYADLFPDDLELVSAALSEARARALG
ncbi:site-specific integrase [Gordonia polyisoprenivorans]|uniref:tyrosine-type recombinase/integrase n=1 Tax=Gordonia polyisoprenivorans TaxID=84595 RepID=UPI002233F9E5|nr:site-specific integrase [Gordonia polyisoprenivorans]